MKNIGFAGLSTVMCLVFAVPVMGQAQPPASAAVTACNGKYTKYYADQPNLQLFNDFVNDPTCKDSDYREGAFQLITQALTAKKDWKGLMDISARLTKEMPNASPKAKTYIYTMGFNGASQLGDADKIIEHGEKVLTLDPNDINAILIVATTIPEKIPAMEAAAKEAALNRAMELAKKLIGMPKPDPVDPKVWQVSVLGPAHGVAGFVHLQRAQYEEAEGEFDQAVKINPKDQMSWYRYGLASTKTLIAAQALIKPAYDDVNENFKTLGPERDAAVAKRDAIEKNFTDKRAKTIEIYISAVALPDPAIVNASRPTLESLYKPLHNNTTEGLAELIAARKAELNK